MDFPVPPESWWSTDILSSLPGKALIGFHRYLMKTNENQLLLIKTYEQWKPTNTNEWKICIWWHLCVWIFCICLFLYFCAGFLFLFYLFAIIVIFFSSSTLLFMRTKEREIISCFWLEFIMMMVILSCSSQWLTEDALGRTLCIFSLYLHSCSFLLFFEAIFLHKEILYSMVNYYWSFHATLHWLNWVLNCKSIIILMEVFRCRTKTTGYHH